MVKDKYRNGEKIPVISRKQSAVAFYLTSYIEHVNFQLVNFPMSHHNSNSNAIRLGYIHAPESKFRLIRMLIIFQDFFFKLLKLLYGRDVYMLVLYIHACLSICFGGCFFFLE